jgi:hypothetical protein
MCSSPAADFDIILLAPLNCPRTILSSCRTPTDKKNWHHWTAPAQDNFAAHCPPPRTKNTINGTIELPQDKSVIMLHPPSLRTTTTQDRPPHADNLYLWVAPPRGQKSAAVHPPLRIFSGTALNSCRTSLQWKIFKQCLKILISKKAFFFFFLLSWSGANPNLIRQ